MAIITISRGTYSGGKELAERLAEKLGYRLLSREQLLTDANKEFGVSQEKLENALLHKPGFFEGVSLQRIHYIAYLTAAMCEEVQGDNVIYQGQAGHLLLKGIPHHLRLKVVADMEYRIKAAMERSNFTRDKAIDYIRQMDEDRDKWVRSIYGVDRNDPLTYDLIVNLEHISTTSACDIVAETVNRDFKTTPESQQLMDNLVLASQVRARIAKDGHIADDHIEVEADNGVITLAGIVRSWAEADKVRELVCHISGIREVNSKMGIRW